MTNQRRLRLVRAAGCAAAVGALGLAAPAAHAADCTTLSNPVVIVGSSAAKPFLTALAATLAKENPPITVITSNPASCDGVHTMLKTGATNLTGTAYSTWGGTADAPVDNGASCTIDAVSGIPADIGVSDVFSDTCGLGAVADDVKDYHGPVQSMNLVVPKDSTQVSISYEAAYLTFGFGDQAGGGVPWNDPTVYEVRKPTSGTMLLTGAVIGVPGARWKGRQNQDTTTVLNMISADITAGQTQKVIGVMSSGDADKHRDVVRALAYQHQGQSCGYTPDSDSTTSFDKANTRDGHYMIAGPLHLYAHSKNGAPTNPNVKRIVDYLTGALDPDFDLIRVEAKNGVVPDCAMRVSRDKDGGALSSYMPDRSCECKFLLEATGSAPASCKTCTEVDKKDTACPSSAPICHYGYCEVQ
jgi:ABC-type phosphate transport system substrate-binding protein